MTSLFELKDRVYVVTGATGALAGSVSDYLVSQGARVVYLGRSRDKIEAALSKSRSTTPDAQCLGLVANVLDRTSLERACDQALERWGRVDGLINGAGGNMPGATISPEKNFTDLDFTAFQEVVDLNLHGTVLPTLVFASALMAGGGSVVNFSSVSAPQAVTRVVGYSAAKSAVENFTRWLAVDMARRTNGKVRANAVLPGFFLGEQNRRLLTNEDGSLTERGSLVVQNTPFGRFGTANELHGAIHFFLSDASRFVTGTVLAVDGGFTAFSESDGRPSPTPSLLQEGFRWFGPPDPVPLSYIRQAGAAVLFSSLHEIPYGELWPQEIIRARREMIEAAGLRWTVVESVPVHEQIKTGKGDLATLFENYRQTLRNLSAEGITTVVYNFMPVLDWVRTNMRYELPDGSLCLRYDPHWFAAFELHALRRPGAEADYTPEQIERGTAWWKSLDEKARDAFVRDIIDVFPGVKWGLGLDDIRAMLARYQGIDETALRNNLIRFLEAVIPTASEVGVSLAIHPDDPPFPVLGLPRIVSTAPQVQAILDGVNEPANGLCFCTGSFSARGDNDLPAMVRQFSKRIHAAHLRSTLRLPDGAFYEADHLDGSVDMPAVVSALLDVQDERRQERAGWTMPFRSDHGHVMMDDLTKSAVITPGYPCIGRMRGLAELRGLMRGLRHAKA